jgi:hypothetical protein
LRTTRTVASQRTEALRLAGTASWLARRTRPARRFWAESLRFGETIGARPELARTWLEIGKRLDPADEIAGVAASEYRRRALQAFDELELRFEFPGSAPERRFKAFS